MCLDPTWNDRRRSVPLPLRHSRIPRRDGSGGPCCGFGGGPLGRRRTIWLGLDHCALWGDATGAPLASRPLCSRRGTLSTLARVEPAEEPDHDLRTFAQRAETSTSEDEISPAVARSRLREPQVRIRSPRLDCRVSRDAGTLLGGDAHGNASGALLPRPVR